MTNDSIQKIKNDYLKGMKYKEIINKYSITHSELRSIIRRSKLTRTKSNAQKGNQNALGNKGGYGTENNKNAVITGEYENIYKDVLDVEELDLYENIETNDKEKLLIDEFKILTIREKRMLKRIKDLKQRGKDMTINFIRSKKNKQETETLTEAEPTIDIIQRIEEGLTRIQETKRKCLESIIKINSNNDDKVVNVNITTNSLLESINRQLGGSKNGTN